MIDSSLLLVKGFSIGGAIRARSEQYAWMNFWPGNRHRREGERGELLAVAEGEAERCASRGNQLHSDRYAATRARNQRMHYAVDRARRTGE